MKGWGFYTTSIVKCENESGIILPRVRHGSAILEFTFQNSSSLSIKYTSTTVVSE